MKSIQNNNHFLNTFEKRISEVTGAPYVVLTDSCSNAIFITIWYLKKIKKIKFPNKIIIPNRTYISVPNAIFRNGLKPVFKKIKWFSRYRIGTLPIWDCAVGFEKNMYIKKQYMCLSFQQKKAIGIGKGGAILLDNKKDYLFLKRLVHDGRDSGIPVSKDTNIIYGFHMNMTPDQAAKGILLLNQYVFADRDLGSYKNYPKLRKICEKNYK